MRGVKYRAVLYDRVSVGFDTFVVYVPDKQKTFTFPSSVQRVLDACHTSDNLEGLANRVSKHLNLSTEKTSWVKGTIEYLVVCELIVPESRLLEALPPLGCETRRTITSLCFPTCDRVLQLEGALLSYARNIEEHSRAADLIVMDDSCSVQSRTHCLHMIRKLRGSSIRYAGRDEKELYLQKLGREGFEPKIARFAVFGDDFSVPFTAGANRNCILLDTIGECVLTVDDDTLCRLAPHPEHDNKLHLSGEKDPRDAWFYRDRDCVVSKVPWCSRSLLAEHESMLARDLVELVLEAGHDVSIDGASDRLLYEVRKRQGRVVATMSGIVGDSGIYSCSSLLRSTIETQGRLCASESVFDQAFRSRESLAVVRGRTITHHALCIAATLGLANLDLLPPFFPLGRNEDGVFGALLRHTTRDFVGHLPIAVFHNAQGGREYQQFPQFRVADLVLSLVPFLSAGRSGDTRSCLRSLGKKLLDVAELDAAEFWAVIFKAALIRKGKHMRMMESAMNRVPECPQFWKNRVEKFYKQSILELNDPDCHVPIEFRQAEGDELARTSAQRLVSITGSFLYSWPDLMDAARHLRSKGVRISRECD
jgi:hypothetical protein